jgi:TolA-binding protein
VCLPLAFLLACSSTAGDAWNASFYAAKRAYNAGRYAEAAELFGAAVKEAVRVKDRDEALFMRARMQSRMGANREAEATYASLLKISPRGPRAARAQIELARIAIDAGEARGMDLLADAIVRYPNDGAVRSALIDVVEHYRLTGGEQAVRARIEPWLPKVAGTEAEQHIEYELGLSLARSGKLDEAHAQLLRTARRHPYPKGSLTDDAFWHASLVAERRGDANQAVLDLRELLATREISQHGQSYERPKYPISQMRIAELYRDKLGDLRKAREEFRMVYAAHPSSTLADDAAWQEGIASLRLNEPEAACSAAKVLLKQFTRSRYLRCVKSLCPSLDPPSGNRECQRYIQAQLEPDAELPRTSAPDPEARDE